MGAYDDDENAVKISRSQLFIGGISIVLCSLLVLSRSNGTLACSNPGDFDIGAYREAALANTPPNIIECAGAEAGGSQELVLVRWPHSTDVSDDSPSAVVRLVSAWQQLPVTCSLPSALIVLRGFASPLTRKLNAGMCPLPDIFQPAPSVYFAGLQMEGAA